MNKNGLFLAFLVILAGTAPAGATTISQLDSSGGRSLFTPSSISGIGQTFTATTTSYDSLAVFLYHASESFTGTTLFSPSSIDSTVTLALYTGKFTTVRQTWNDIDLSSLVDGDNRRLNIDISGFTFTSGALYAFALFNDTNEWLAEYTASNPYSSGSMYLFNSDTPYLSASSDLKFEITADPVPLPSTLALFGTGLIGLLPALTRKSKKS
ncbi:MAG: PEP-CTERM sorting domain-containing protein [Thermodesulfobacteriota bacterium]